MTRVQEQHLYFLPGTMCDQRLWSPLIEEIKGNDSASLHFHFLSIPQLATIDEILKDIKSQLLEQPVVLIGFSLGGYLASALAVNYPQYIAKLVVLSNMPSALPQQELKERSRTISWLRQRGYNGIPTKRILDLLAPKAQSNDVIIEQIKAMDASLGQEVLLQQLQATTQRENLAAKLRELPCEKRFAVGDSDKLADVNKLTEMASRDAKMQLTVFANTGHMLPLEQPQQLAQWLVEVIKT